MITEELLIKLLSQKRFKNTDIEIIYSLLREIGDWGPLHKKLSKTQTERLRDLMDKKHVKDSLEIINEFNKAGINFVVLKGLTLRKFNKKRRFFDLDVLIDRKDFERALKICKKWYKCAFSDKKIKKIIKFRLFGLHHISFSDKNMIHLELHLSLSLLFYGLDSESLDLKNNKIYLYYEGIKIPCLAPELQLLNCLIHGFMHAIKQSFNIEQEKREIEDISLILSHYKIDWYKFVKIAKDFNCLEIIYLLLKKINKSKKGLIPHSALNQAYSLSSKWRLILISSFYRRLAKLKNKRLGYLQRLKFNVILYPWALLLNLYSKKRFEMLFFFFMRLILRLDKDIAHFFLRGADCTKPY